MKHFKQILLAVLVASASPFSLYAHDFEAVNKNGVTIYYKITSDADQTCAVSFMGEEYNSKAYSGNVVIPESVLSGGKVYKVAAIGDHAFYGCSSLSGIEIPNSVTELGESAFYGCI